MNQPSRFRQIRIVVSALVFAAAWFAFALGNDTAAALFQMQFAPALSRMTTVFSITALVIFLILAVGTFFFGRVYCAALCPLGIAQDIIDALVPRKHRVTIPNPRKFRYFIAIVTFTLVFAGYAIGLRLFDPYSNIGAAFAGSGAIREMFHNNDLRAMTWVLPLIIIVVMVVWKRRLFCVSLCPVGTILGLLSKHAVYNVNFASSCTTCGRCVPKCPVDCIDARNKRVDNERCIRCMSCIATCQKGGIAFSRKNAFSSPVLTECPDQARRTFLVRGTMAAVGAAALGYGGRRILPQAAWGEDAPANQFLPPGASNARQFSQRCTHCLLCVAVCPSRIIKPATSRYGHVHLDLSTGQCQYNCVKCTQVCPTGALQPLSLSEKRRFRIGVASYNPRNCRVLHQESECGLCIQACPTGAIHKKNTINGLHIPQLENARCIGCGSCQTVCPVLPKAITIHFI